MVKRVIAIIAFVAVFFISLQYAEAKILTIEGENENIAILLIIEDNKSVIKLDSKSQSSEHWNSKIKFYKSGGFSIKNYESGIAVYGHPISESQYDLTILTSAGVQRLTASTNQINETTVDDDTPQRIEPKSSVGADISKYDIPTQGRAEHTPYVKQDKVHDPDSLDLLWSIPKTVQYKHTLNFDITAIDNQIKSERDQRLGNVLIKTSMISPLEEIVETWEGYTNDFGVFSGSFYVPDNQRIGEYTLDIVGNKENYTSMSYAISFFIISLDDGGSRCGGGFFFNSTSASCQVE